MAVPPSAPSSATYRMADRLAGGRLRQILEDHAAAGLSLQQISLRLFADYGIEVTRQTVSNWLAEISAGDGTPA